MADESFLKGEEEIVHTTCPYCGVGCGVSARVNKTLRSVIVQGLDSHPANFGMLCSKGGALGSTIELAGRLLTPEVNGTKVTWDEALNAVADGFSEIIKQHGPDAIAFYLSGQLLTEDYYVANKLMKGFIGSANIDTNSRLCMSSSVMGHKLAFGTDTVPGCYEDFEQADLIILVGSNTIWCHPVLYQRIRIHKENNPHVKIIVIDPRRTQTCEIADLHLPLALGSDTWLFNGLLNYLFEQNKIDTQFLDEFCQGFDGALAAAKLSSSTIESVAVACGIESSLVKDFYEAFAATEKTLTLYSQGVNQSSSGTDKVNAIINCHLATNRIGRPGMGPFSMTGQPNAMGGREVGGLSNTLAAHLDFTKANVNRVKRFWESPELKTNVAKEPGLTAIELFNAIDEGKIKAVWIMATNPLVSLPNAHKVKTALKKCELVIVSDCVADTDTLKLANIKLPATGWSEKNGTVTNSERSISRQRNLFPPAGESKHDWWIISQVARKLGFKDAFEYSCPSAIFKEHAALSGFENNDQGMRRDFDISALQHISKQAYDDLQPFQWPLNSNNPQGTQRMFSQGNFFTEQRLANLIAITPRKPVNPPSKSYPYALNTGRIRDQWHTMTRTGLVPELNQHIKEPYLELNSQDCDKKMFSDGELIRIESQWGKMFARLKVTEGINAGECFVPIHWSNQNSRQTLAGSVTNPAIDPQSFQPESKHTPVQLSAFNANWYGLLLHRNTVSWPDAEYCVEVKSQCYTQYILASQTPLTNPINTIKKWMGIKNSWELLIYEDRSQSHYRIAALDKNSKLQGVGFISNKYDVPDTTWLGMQFTLPSIDQHTRSALLSGRAPAGADIGPIICSCYSVGEKAIVQLMLDKNVRDVESIGRHLKAGTKCGSCVPEINALINKLV